MLTDDRKANDFTFFAALSNKSGCLSSSLAT